MEEHQHTTRLTEAGFVICVCGWATAAVDEDPADAAATHIAEATSGDGDPVWVERPGGRICVPGGGAH